MARRKKKAPIWVTVIALLLVAAIVVCFVLHKKGVINIPFLNDESSSESVLGSDDGASDSSGGNASDSSNGGSSDSANGGSSDSSNGGSSDGSGGGDVPPVVTTDALSIHFLELGNKYAGDCTLIDIGETEILIDAGSIKGSAATIVPYIKQYCADGVLEYVIATHAHEDHIAAFVGTSSAKGIFDSFECETIIDYALSSSTTQIRKDYETKRDAEVASGAKHYTVLECWNNANGAKRSYTLGEGITMNFLYQKYYEEKTNDENDYSVCMLLTQGENNYLFTGDLEEKGEASLVEKNTLPKCKLYKGGHHGSPTSSTDALLKMIQPEIICVCCCAGSNEYTSIEENKFPSQEFVNRIASYTDKVYVTTLAINDTNGKTTGYKSMNGNIVVSCTDGKRMTVNCTNNNILLKDTDWFKENRTMPDAWQS
ncbi:MAG: MBL fold metallo-hydrolase [Clostridia bacterium]|nr:MBL fold metallo-hydrolase [Clostridia bacterium]